MPDQAPPDHRLPVLIMGAGISGLVLAQHLRSLSVPFVVFERDSDLATRGLGWGLTLHWSLPALRNLIPDRVYGRLPEAYVDRAAVERGEASRFPFYDLSTGELRAATPKAPEGQRIRVTRANLRRLLAEGIDIQWGKTFSSYESTPSSVTVTFEDGSSRTGCLLVACDGGASRVRRALFPSLHERHQIPVRTMGFRADFTPREVRAIRAMDPFFLQAAASENDTFMYFSILSGPRHPRTQSKRPRNGGSKGRGGRKKLFNKYTCQIVVSWPDRPGFFGEADGVAYPTTDEGRVGLLHRFASTWAEPFRSLALGIGLAGKGGAGSKRSSISSSPSSSAARSPSPASASSASTSSTGEEEPASRRAPRGGVATEIKTMDLFDWPPPKGLRGTGRVVLMGDAMHQMTMYRGEGANHAIVDVQDFADLVAGPHLAPTQGPASFEELRRALDAYEDAVVERARPGVLASRRACLDAHEWGKIGEASPLLTRRAMKLDFDEE